MITFVGGEILFPFRFVPNQSQTPKVVIREAGELFFVVGFEVVGALGPRSPTKVPAVEFDSPVPARIRRCGAGKENNFKVP